MRVFVAGGTGAIGKRLVPMLVSRGHEVTATTRSRDRLASLRALGATAVVMDGLDAQAVAEAVARAEPEAVIHQMTSLAGGLDTRRFDRCFAVTNALRTRGTEHLLAAAGAAGVDRVLAQSYTTWTNARSGHGLATEDEPLEPDPPEQQRETLAAIRFLEQAVTQASRRGVVLRYGSLYGPQASEPLVELVRRRRLPVVGGGTGIWSWVHVDDAAAATVAALEGGGGGVYNVVDDDPAPVSDWLPYLARVVGARPPLRVPAWLGRIAGGEVGVSLMTRTRGSSNQKARRELGWSPSFPTWREGFRRGLTDAAPAARAGRAA